MYERLQREFNRLAGADLLDLGLLLVADAIAGDVQRCQGPAVIDVQDVPDVPGVRRLTCKDTRGNGETMMSETRSTLITISGALLQRAWPLRPRARFPQD